MTITEIKSRVERYYGRPLDWKSRNLEKMEPRRVFILACLKNSYHPVQIANFVGCNRTTILYHEANNSEYYEMRVDEILNASTTSLDIDDVTEQIKYQLLKPLMDKLTITEVREILPMLQLRIDAKQWKNNDETKVYDCSTGIGHLVH